MDYLACSTKILRLIEWHLPFCCFSVAVLKVLLSQPWNLQNFLPWAKHSSQKSQTHLLGAGLNVRGRGVGVWWGEQRAEQMGAEGTRQHRTAMLASPALGHLQAHTWAAGWILLSALTYLFHPLYSCRIIAFCCPQGWQWGRGVLFISSWAIVHVPSQSPGLAAAGLGPRASPECAPGRGARWPNLYNAASSLIRYLGPYPLPWSWGVWTNRVCLWQKLLLAVRGRSCLEGSVLGSVWASLLLMHTRGILPPSRAKVLVLRLGPLSGCAKGDGLLNSDGRRAAGPGASAQHGGGSDPALWCEIRAILQWNCSWSLDGLGSGLLSSGMSSQGWGSKCRGWSVH